jgi:hypothetical protein
MDNKNEKVTLNEELLDKVAGGIYIPSLDFDNVRYYECKCEPPFPDPTGTYCTSCGQSLR